MVLWSQYGFIDYVPANKKIQNSQQSVPSDYPVAGPGFGWRSEEISCLLL